MTTQPENTTPAKEPKSGRIDTQRTLAPGLARAMVEAMDAANLIEERVLTWYADPVKRTITFSAQEVR